MLGSAFQDTPERPGYGVVVRGESPRRVRILQRVLKQHLAGTPQGKAAPAEAKSDSGMRKPKVEMRIPAPDKRPAARA